MNNSADLAARVGELEKCVLELEDLSLSAEEKRTYEKVCILIFGDEELGIPSMRDQVNEVYLAWDRAKWLLGIIGISSLGTIVTLILLLREVFGG